MGAIRIGEKCIQVSVRERNGKSPSKRSMYRWQGIKTEGKQKC
jgi:hypothetical protein